MLLARTSATPLLSKLKPRGRGPGLLEGRTLLPFNNVCSVEFVDVDVVFNASNWRKLKEDFKNEFVRSYWGLISLPPPPTIMSSYASLCSWLRSKTSNLSLIFAIISGATAPILRAIRIANSKLSIWLCSCLSQNNFKDSNSFDDTSSAICSNNFTSSWLKNNLPMNKPKLIVIRGTPTAA